MSKPAKAFSKFAWTKRTEARSVDASEAVHLAQMVERSDFALLWSTNEAGEFTTFYAPALLTLGVVADQVVGQRLSSVFEDAPTGGEMPQRALTLKTGARSKINDHIVRLPDAISQNNEIWLQISGRPVVEQEVFRGYFGTAANVTNLVIEQQKKLVQEKFDQLTGFQNAAYFAKRFETVFSSLAYAQRSVALMTLDIDHFRSINERHGSATADTLLAEFSSRLCNLVAQRGELGRVSGDQFRIILADAEDRGELVELAARFDKMLSQPYRINGRRIQISLSIGIAIAPFDAIEASDLIDAANLALLAAKQGGGARHCLYSAEVASQAALDLEIERELEGALSRGEFSLVYTPVIDTASNALISLSAQLQWENAQLGPVPLETLWPMIDASPAAASIGEWMLRQACSDASSWPEDLRFAIHLPQSFYRDPDLRRIMREAADSCNLSCARIEAEISEGALAYDLAAAAKILGDVAAVGAKAVIRDFGEGNSSITMLADLKVERVDLSPNLARNWAANRDRTNAILTALVSLARTFGLTTSIRSVDAMDVLDAVVACGIDLAQGPIFASPLRQEEIVSASEAIFKSYTPQGPKVQRADRITLLRKIGLIHDDHYYDGLLKNISTTGAKITGIAGVPVGTEVVIDLGNGQLAVAEVVNSDDHSQGVRFEVPLVSDGHGGLMTRHRISPYALAEAGLPLGALSPDFEALKVWKDTKRSPPRFVQLQLSSR